MAHWDTPTSQTTLAFNGFHLALAHTPEQGLIVGTKVDEQCGSRLKPAVPWQKHSLTAPFLLRYCPRPIRCLTSIHKSSGSPYATS